MAEPAPLFTPVTLITGFLGSGKTTLLRALLTQPALADTAVLINEFGEIGLDHHLLERIDERTVLLASGCLCCTVRGELAEAMRDLHSRRERGTIPAFRRLAIESTGLADPFPVLTTLHAEPVLRHHFRMGHVVTTVDAVNGAHTLAAHPESVKQVAVADRIVLTKTDLVDSSGAVERRVRAINPTAPLLRGGTGEVLAAFVLGGDAPHLRDAASRAWFEGEMRAAAALPGETHAPGVSAFAIVVAGAIDWPAFGLWLTMLLHRHGAAVLRVKGILNVAGSAGPVAIHGVQHLVHPPQHMAAWPDDDRRSRLVFIVDGLNRDEIERSFRAFCGLDRAATVAAA